MLQHTRLVSTILLAAMVLPAQNLSKPSDNGKIRVSPDRLTLPVGEKAQLQAQLLDKDGKPTEGRLLYISRARRSVRVSRSGEVSAIQPGDFEIVIRGVVPGGGGPEAKVLVSIPFPKPAAIVLEGAPTTLYTGTTVRVTGAVIDKNERPRTDLRVRLSSSNENAMAIDAYGFLTAGEPGNATLLARGGGIQHEHEIRVLENPVRGLDLTASHEIARTGDVVHFRANLKGVDGTVIEGVPVQYSLLANPDDTLGNGATGQIEQDGRFVAETPGLYTVIAQCGQATDRLTIRCNQRLTEKKKLKKIGHGPVLDVHTSDLWVWEGVDGRDYCVTGTWGANGDAHFWDVTDPERIERIATVTVDARTVNDVKVSADGRLCIISREGASNRKNGIVAFDVTDPHKPKRVSAFDDELTGGVHNLFIDKGYAYALSAGRRYDVLDIKNPLAPTRVGSYQIFEPGASIHDVWIEDGIAYSSNWRYGVHMVDIGNGIRGGSPSNPVKIASYAYPTGWNHAAFPWRSKDTGKFYVVAGDEAFPFGLHTKNHPTYPRGWIHFIDFTNLDEPKEVARYQVPEAGTHNLWIEGNTLYVAYYNGGLRVVDLSGELMGDLYRQGREIAWYIPTHPKGVVPNAPMVWGPQPHKGKIFFSDWNSGLWCVELVEDTGRRR